MTIEELKARRDELRAQKRREEELLAAGEGDNMALFVVNEELLEVNAQIRALSGTRRRIGGRAVSLDSMGGGRQADKSLLRAWEQEQEGEEVDKHRILADTIAGGKDFLTEKQYTYLTEWMAGATMETIAEKHGVSKSSVSRVIANGKRRLQNVAEAAETAAAIGTRRVDLSDPDMAQKILSALTPRQAVYIYLYYGEWLTLREIARLLDLKSHQTVLVSIRVGLRNIGRVCGYGLLELQNLEKLDELAYSIYQTIDPDQLLPRDAREQIHQKLRAASRNRPLLRRSVMPEIAMERNGYITVATRAYWRRPEVPVHGKLLRALLDRKRAMQTTGRSIGVWLLYIFKRVSKNIGGKLRKNHNGGANFGR